MLAYIQLRNNFKHLISDNFNKIEEFDKNNKRIRLTKQKVNFFEEREETLKQAILKTVTNESQMINTLDDKSISIENSQEEIEIEEESIKNDSDNNTNEIVDCYHEAWDKELFCTTFSDLNKKTNEDIQKIIIIETNKVKKSERNQAKEMEMRIKNLTENKNISQNKPEVNPIFNQNAKPYIPRKFNENAKPYVPRKYKENPDGKENVDTNNLTRNTSEEFNQNKKTRTNDS